MLRMRIVSIIVHEYVCEEASDLGNEGRCPKVGGEQSMRHRNTQNVAAWNMNYVIDMSLPSERQKNAGFGLFTDVAVSRQRRLLEETHIVPSSLQTTD
jgi:hypothetical protein